MIIPVFFFIGIAAMILSYSLGQGGPIGAMVFFLFLFTGATLHYAKPLIDRLRA